MRQALLAQAAEKAVAAATEAQRKVEAEQQDNAHIEHADKVQ